jgi:tetratricopeptide (TPR) repeat protein
MRFILCMTLCAVGIAQGQAVGDRKSWSDFLSEGKALCDSGNYSAAAEAFRHALALADESSIDHNQLTQIHDGLAGAYAEAGQYTASESEYRRTLALVESAEGTASLKYAVVLASMAVLPTQSGDPEPVIRLLRNALSTHAQSVDSADSLTVISGCLALLLRNQRRYGEAEPLLVKAITDLEREKVPSTHLLAGFLNDLAVLRLDQGRRDESLDLQRRSIQLLESALGSEHPSLVVPLNNLASTYFKVGRFDDANAMYQRAIKVCAKTLGQDHSDYGVLLKNQAVVLKKLGQKRQAKKVEAQGFQIERAANRRNGIGQTIRVDKFPSKSATP